MVVTNKKRITLYIDEDIKAEVEKLAKFHNRSASNFIESLCAEAIRKAKQEGIIQ